MVVLVAACETESSRTTTPPPPVSTAQVVRLELTGPDTIHIDQAEQFTVTAVRSDGTTTDVTTQASWHFPSGMLTMSAPGRFIGKAKGETTLTVSTSGRSAVRSVIVVPVGTYRIKGTVRDTGTPVGAHVRVENGASGTVDLDSNSGQYSVLGVVGQTRITVTKDGYREESRTESIGEHRVIDIDLTPSKSRADISGTYTLSITAAETCSRLPEDARSRTFTASIAQNGPQLSVTLSGREFGTDRGRTLNQFGGFLEAERAVFRFTDIFAYYYSFTYTPDILERISDNHYYGWDGTAVVLLSRDRLAGTLSGAISTFTGPPFRVGTGCFASNHRFEFTR